MYKSGNHSVLRWICQWNEMILKYGCQWVVAVLLYIPTANLQMPMQVFQMPPMYGYPPPPLPVAMSFPAPPPIAFQIVEIREPSSKNKVTNGNNNNDPSQNNNINNNNNNNINNNNNNNNNNINNIVDNSNERAKKTIGIAIPLAFPPPVQFAMPAFGPPDFCRKSPSSVNCPVCPPCVCNPCTPSFFSYCSPCHMKCRCRSGQDAPVPLPHEAPAPMSGPAYPMPMSGTQGVLYPVHNAPGRSSARSAESYESSEVSMSTSSEWRNRKKKTNKLKMLKLVRKKKKIKPLRRRSYEADITDNDFAKPVLSYISYDGDIKMEKALSNDEAAALMDENQLNQRVQIVTDEDTESQRASLKVISNIEHNNVTNDFPESTKRRHVRLKSGLEQHVLREGKKELVFNPPTDKKISNLSVSFQITK